MNDRRTSLAEIILTQKFKFCFCIQKIYFECHFKLHAIRILYFNFNVPIVLSNYNSRQRSVILGNQNYNVFPRTVI